MTDKWDRLAGTFTGSRAEDAKCKCGICVAVGVTLLLLAIGIVLIVLWKLKIFLI